MNQEAHSGPVTRQFLEKLYILPDFIVNKMYINGTYYHPTFLYESLWNIIECSCPNCTKKILIKKRARVFSCLPTYGNSIGRFFIEGLRE